MATLLDDIETFLATSGMSPTRLGDDAIGDRHLVHQLRRSQRRIWPETEAKVRQFMESHGATVCGVCERRADNPEVRACVASNCGLRAKEAA
jgi:hypothetical protein